ncbi:MAG: hypothetical protein AAB434_06970 [Planctomycetota bacterium]
MKLLSFLVLVLGMTGLMWISDDRRTRSSDQANAIPTKVFQVPDFPQATSPILRVLDGWNLRHYREVLGQFRREWEVHGESVAMDADDNAFVLRPVLLFCEYPESGEGDPRMVTFHAERGRYSKGMEAVRLEGEVRARTADGSELSATDLVSSLQKKDLRAIGDVHLHRAGLDLRGRGFTSDTQLTNLAFDRWVEIVMRASGGPSVLRSREGPRPGAGKDSLDTTIITCSHGMTFTRLTKPGEKGSAATAPEGPVRYDARFEGDVQLLRDVPGGGVSRMSCDALEAIVVEVDTPGQPATTTIEKLTARGRVRVQDADGRMECDLLLVERKDETLEIVTLSGKRQRVTVARTTGGRGLPGSGDAPSGPLEAACSGPLVIERRSGKEARTKALFRQSVSVSQPGSLVLADELDLLLLPADGATGLSSLVARGHVNLQSGPKVALADHLDWDRASQVTKLTGASGVEVVQEDRRIRSRELTLRQGPKGEQILATGEVRIETPDLSASGASLDWDPGRERMEIVAPPGGEARIETPDFSATGARIDWDQAKDRMEVSGPPDVVVKQEGSTIQCRGFLLLRGERRMIADGSVWMHFIDDPVRRGKTRVAAPVLPGAAPKEGEKSEADLWCDHQEFTWREDGGMERMVSTGTVALASGGTRAWGSRFDWDAVAGVGSLEDLPWAVATSAADPAKPEESPAVFHARRIRFTSTGLLFLQGPKEVRMEREAVDEKGNRTREVVVAVCERDLLIQDRGKEMYLDRNVRVMSGEASILCDRMRVFTDPETGRVSRLLAWGRVQYRSMDGLALAKQMEWTPDTRATDLRSLPPAVMIDEGGGLLKAEHINISDHGKRMVAENEYRRRDIWLPGNRKK